MSLYKFIYIPLLKNDGQLKQKKWQITKKEKKQSPNLLKNKNKLKKIMCS